VQQQLQQEQQQQQQQQKQQQQQQQQQQRERQQQQLLGVPCCCPSSQQGPARQAKSAGQPARWCRDVLESCKAIPTLWSNAVERHPNGIVALQQI
jgi:hypothetical protein